MPHVSDSHSPMGMSKFCTVTSPPITSQTSILLMKGCHFVQLMSILKVGRFQNWAFQIFIYSFDRPSEKTDIEASEEMGARFCKVQQHDQSWNPFTRKIGMTYNPRSLVLQFCRVFFVLFCVCLGGGRGGVVIVFSLSNHFTIFHKARQWVLCRTWKWLDEVDFAICDSNMSGEGLPISYHSSG